MANETVEIDYLNMSDEDLAKIDPNTVAPVTTAVAEVAEEVSNPAEKVVTDESNDADGGTSSTGGNEEANEGQAAAEKGSEGLLTEDGVSDANTAKGKTESNPEPKASETTEGKDKKEVVDPADTKVADAPNYEALYKQITAPFKANGREITVKGVEDAIALMQMGANYNKKMAALKPNLKLMKLLENNGLLNEDKISFLIDLEKKNPEAINKLVKDSGLDPLDLSTEKAGDYKPNTYAVDDREMELDAVLDEIQHTPSYNQTLGIVSNKWDGASKQVIANSPQLLKVINSHVQSGIYDLINKEIESERMFGRLEGLSDIEAYRQVGDAIQARGGFDHLGTQPQGQQVQTKPVVVQPKPKTVESDALREKKLAAGSTKPVAASPTRQDYNPLSLSDDAFSKLVNDSYL